MEETILDEMSNITTFAPLAKSTPKYIDNFTYHRLQYFKDEYAEIHGYMAAIVCVFGIVANTANVVVLNKKHMRTSTNVILMWLAVADLCTMMEYVPFALKFYVFKDPGIENLHVRSYSWMCYLLFHANFSITMHSVSIWLTIMLAMFRFLYIFFPGKGSIYCSIKHAKVVIVTVYISAVVVCIPNYISNYWKVVYQTIGNEPNVTLYTFAQRKESVFKSIFDLSYWLQSILIKLVPCFLLTVLTILLISALRRAHRHHVQLKSQGMRKADVDSHHEHIRTTAMLLAVVILFLITELPQGILTLLMIFMENLHTEVYNPLGDILDIAALMNNAINFVLYCTMSKQFRDTFTDTFCRCFTTGNTQDRWTSVNFITARNGTTRKTSCGVPNGEMV